MTTDARIAAFLTRAGWNTADRAPLAGDASNRRYDRLRLNGKPAVLMIAPPERGEDVRPFVKIADHLTGAGFSAPEILARDDDAGLLLIEDLGDDLYARHLERHPADERVLYEAAVDLLVDLHDHPLPQVDDYDLPLLLEKAHMAWDWYAGRAPSPDFDAGFTALAAKAGPLCDVLALRDYHAENLIWLPDRQGTSRVGLLDFQDALRGSRAYDLVSLLEDARRDVPDELRKSMIDRYIAAAGVDADTFRLAFCLIGAQRNLRILGTFARLCQRDGKPHYLSLIPRVWDHLMRDLSHPDMVPLATIVHAELPEPTPAHLSELEHGCPRTA